MSQNIFQGSFFPSSQAIITGGSFIINNNKQVPGTAKGTCFFSILIARFNSKDLIIDGYERLLDFVAPNALYDSGHIVDPPKCHPGTRVAIIETIMDWIAGLQEVTRRKHITWLTGGAGAGKSAIGRTVCERCAEEGALLASFFFGSNDSTRNHSRSLIATIAYQICAISPSLRKAVSDFIDYDPLIFTRSLRKQFSSLVIEPLATNYANEPQKIPPLIVLDGLDECLDPATQREILETLLYAVTSSLIPLRVLVCSRPESNIAQSFSAVEMGKTVFKIFVGDVYSSYDDIRLYLWDNFKRIREGHMFKASIPPSWPSEEAVEKLIECSSGQFIYASTVIYYIESSRYRPHQRLDAVLGLRPPFKDLPFSELDALYTHLLKSTDDPSLTTDILAFLSLYGSVRPKDIDIYLGLEAGQAELVLIDVAAIVRMKMDEPNDVCEAFLLHKSFEDFLFDSYRSKELSKSRADTRVSHIIRAIQMFPGEYYPHMF